MADLKQIVKISKENYEILINGGEVQGYVYNPDALYLIEDTGGSGGGLEEVTYQELVNMRNSGSLTPGKSYRITDYECTTVQEGTQSAGHVFDIIVTADSEDTLNENARAIKHEGDTYFENCDLSAWELKYSIDNDTARFVWADEEDGKGVVFYMKDEFNNECPYDFKNIQFERYKVTNVKAYYKKNGNYDWYDWTEISGDDYHYLVAEDAYALSNMSIVVNTNDNLWCYTFCGYEDEHTEDLTVWQANTGDGVHCFNNKIKASTNSEYDSTDVFYLNNICIIDNDGCGDAMKNNSFDGDCYNITVWGYYFSDNQFGCYNHDNTFGNGVYRNTFGNDVYGNTFGNYIESNTFGNEVWYNTFGNEVYYNTFGNYVDSNTFGNEVYYNTFGNSIGSNTFGNDVYSNTFGNDIGYNTFGNEVYYNTFGNDVYGNTFGNYIESNTFGNSIGSNTFGNDIGYNTFGNSIANNNILCGYFYYNTIENNMSHCIMDQTTSDGAYLMNLHFLNGLSHTVDTSIFGATDEESSEYCSCEYCQMVGRKSSDGSIVIKNVMD